MSSVVFYTILGVRQGLPTSCLLFVIYANDPIKLVKASCEDDGFLKWLHILTLTSASCEGRISKLSLMKQRCEEYGVKVNACKSKFFVIHDSAEDIEFIRVDGLVAERCTRYVHLFTADGSVEASIRAHADSRMDQVMKFKFF